MQPLKMDIVQVYRYFIVEKLLSKFLCLNYKGGKLIRNPFSVSRYGICIALYGRPGNKRSNLNERKFDVNFLEF